MIELEQTPLVDFFQLKCYNHYFSTDRTNSYEKGIFGGVSVAENFRVTTAGFARVNKIKLKILNFQVSSCDAVSRQSISVDILLTLLTSQHPDGTNVRTLNQA